MMKSLEWFMHRLNVLGEMVANNENAMREIRALEVALQEFFEPRAAFPETDVRQSKPEPEVADEAPKKHGLFRRGK